MAGEYAFVMKDLRKVVSPKREILRGIWLSFFHGAKIGVVGANGAGKSTLLRIMAGVDDDFQGEASPAAGLRIGYLPQEPQLDPVARRDADGIQALEHVAVREALAARARPLQGVADDPVGAEAGLDVDARRVHRPGVDNDVEPGDERVAE